MMATPILERREVVARILEQRGDALVVAGLGSCVWDVTAAGDVPLNFHVWGAMGGTAMIGLGLALAQPARRVLVITGDGEMLMAMGSFATIAVARPRNLAVIVIDNEHYGETGMQPTHTHHGVDLAGVALATGFPYGSTVRNSEELSSVIPELYQRAGPVFTDIKVTATPLPNALPPRDGTYLKHRFREALLGKAAYE
jgi:thiamine pyrophosphate-dependent acetolactate synthase large subunit-like protein